MNTFLFHGNYNSEIQQAILRNLNQLHTYICWKKNTSFSQAASLCVYSKGTSTAVWTSFQLFYYSSAPDTRSHSADSAQSLISTVLYLTPRLRGCWAEGGCVA